MEFVVNPDRLVVLERNCSPVGSDLHNSSVDFGAGIRDLATTAAVDVHFPSTQPDHKFSLIQESDFKGRTTRKSIKFRGTVEQEYEDKITSFTNSELESLSSQPARSLRGRNVHPALAFAVLKDRLAKRVVDIKALFPAECFQFQGRILPHHLRNALEVVGISVSHSDFSKLWNRFDRQNVGVIQIRQFLKDVDLDMLGRPLTTIRHAGVTASSNVLTNTQHPKTARYVDLKMHGHSLEQGKTSSCVCQSTGLSSDKYLISNGLMTKLPQGRDLTEAVLKGFRLYDPDDDGVISIRNFVHVLEEFAVVIPQSISNFLSSSSRKGQWIHYKEYLSHFKPQLAIRPGNDRRLLTTRMSPFRGEESFEQQMPPLEEILLPAVSFPILMKNIKVVQEKTAVRTILLKIQEQVRQQRDYLKTYFQVRDRMGLGHIAVAEIKSIMDRMYWGLTEKEQELLCDAFDLKNNGRFHYAVFLENV